MKKMTGSIRNLFLKTVFFVLPVVIGCKAQYTSTKAAKAVSEKVMEIEINPDFSPPDRVDFTIDSGRVKGKVLSLYLRYYGGCKEHDFQLVGTNYIKKSLPPQTELFLVHQTNSDSCYRPMQKVINFNLSKLETTEFEQIILDVNHQVYLNYQPNQPSLQNKK